MAGDGLTIFIPNWNHGAYLPRAIRSARAAATYLEGAGFATEIIVADDASRDGSPRLLRSMEMYSGDPRMRLLLRRVNVGVARLRNLGLKAARYRHVLLLDADNELVPENAPLFMRAMIDTGAALLYGHLLDMLHGYPVGMRSNEAANWRLTVGNWIDAMAIVDAATVLRLGGYSSHPDLLGWEDWELALHLIAERAEIVSVPAVMGYYHLTPRSMTSDNLDRLAVARSYVQRVYCQSGSREWDREQVGRSYHPDIGWMD